VRGALRTGDALSDVVTASTGEGWSTKFSTVETEREVGRTP